MNETSNLAAIEKEAASWYARLNSGEVLDADWEKFDAWRATDPAHALTYAEISLVWEDIGELDLAASSDKITSPAKAHIPPGQILSDALSSLEAGFRNPFGKIAAFSGAAAALFAFMWLGALYGGAFDHRYETAIGATKTITTNDGSQIELNTNSQLRVAFRLQRRRIFLDRGQAYFDVARQERRPFIVRANDTSVTVTGTRFDVDISKKNKISVSVAEGLVSIALNDQNKSRHTAPQMPEVAVSGGKRFEGNILDNSHELRDADIDNLLAWRRNQLIFQNASLSEAIAELSRYTPMRLSIDDQTLADRTFSGVIQLSDPAAIISSLEAVSGAKSVRLSDTEIIFQARPE